MGVIGSSGLYQLVMFGVVVKLLRCVSVFGESWVYRVVVDFRWLCVECVYVLY